MEEYHKIQTVFKRDPDTNHKTLLMNEYSMPEFDYLKNNLWVFTEKIDGTNIRVSCDRGIKQVLFGGRTERANIPAKLVASLNSTFSFEALESVFGQDDFCLYGEGFGAGIQSGGNYRPDQGFILFDVKVGEWWLQREDIEGVASSLGIDVVPVVGTGTLRDMVQRVYENQSMNSTFGDFKMEGFVAKPATELKTRGGQRIITKIKCKDFR